MKKSAIKKSSKKPIKKSKKLNSRILVSDIRKLIEETRSAIAVVVNSGLTILYWRIGKKINDEILKNKRAEYGEEIVVTLSRQLVNDYGNGFSEKNIRRMIQFSEVFPKEKIVVTLSRQLTWSHFVTLIPIKDQLKIDFYSEMCRIEMWS
ncbi:cytoplasmic protein, partial [Candidatus Dependentiae bacterium]|nr:cytoplasmic protein [Candidatus Dependentiae bacterium]